MSVDLRILHCLHAPLGGVLRHVHDLAQGQAELGAEIGVVCGAQGDDADTGAALTRLSYPCSLGIARMKMPSRVGLAGWLTASKIAKLAAKLNIDVLHGHGAEGGAYARLAARKLKRKGRRIKAVYTPHGGTLYHSPASLIGRFTQMTERRLVPLTDGLIFDSRFARQLHVERVGPPNCPVRIIPNGLYRHEVYESLLEDDAADFVFIGELSKKKGVDIFLEAMAANQTLFSGKAIIVGSGPEEEHFKRLARKLRLGTQVTFTGPLSARTAFFRARCVVVPSRAESFPYVVLEAAAARMPLIATNVGGIGEIVGHVPMKLIPPNDVAALASQLRLFLAEPKAFLARAVMLQKRVAERFTVEKMTQDTVDFYITGIGAGSYLALPQDAATAT
ncbi:MAG: glycosyltransferase family 4 protein [Methyloceanibacter sp.]